MKNKKWAIAVMTGCMLGQVFAEGESPLSIVNTLRVGYDDNPYYESDGDGSAFIEDIIDVAFRASLTDRTDASVKIRLMADSDKEDNGFYPNIHGVLSHAVSPRLLMQLSDTFKTDNRNGDIQNPGERADYWRNTVKLNGDYMVNGKNRIGAAVANTVEENDDAAALFDFTRNDVELSWTRELNPQQTDLSFYYVRSMLDYDAAIQNDYDMDSLYSQLSHTFNPSLNGYLFGGLTYVNYDRGDSDAKPKFGAGVSYFPSPRTELSADGSYSFEQSGNANYSGGTIQSIRFGVEHELTAKVTVSSNVRFTNSEYDAVSQVNGSTFGDTEEDRFEWASRVRYKLNRVHSLEAGYKYAEKDSDTTQDWEQNRVDLGWRVEL